MLPTHLKMLPQLLTGIATPESISAQNRKAAGHKLAQLIRMGFLIIRCGNDRPGGTGQLLSEVWHTRCLGRMQSIPSRGVVPIARQFVHARHAPYIRRDTEISCQQISSGLNLTQNGAGAEELHNGPALCRYRAQAVQAPNDAILNALGHIGMHIVLIHRGDVIEAVLTLLEHATHPVLNNYRQLIGIGRVVANAVGHCCSNQVAVPILML